MYFVADISEFISCVTNVIFIMFQLLNLIKEVFSINNIYLAVSHDYHDYYWSLSSCGTFLVGGFRGADTVGRIYDGSFFGCPTKLKELAAC